MKLQDIVLALVVATMCIAFLAIIGLAYVGKVDSQQIVTFVLTGIGSLIAAAGAWIGATRSNETRIAAMTAQARAEGALSQLQTLTARTEKEH